jgi:hypothetical protein
MDIRSQPSTRQIWSNSGKSCTVEKGKGLDRLRELQQVPTILNSRHLKVATLSARCTGRFCLPEKISVIHFCWRLSPPEGHNAVGRIKPVKNIKDRSCDLTACSALPRLHGAVCNKQVLSVSIKRRKRGSQSELHFWCVMWHMFSL